MCQLLPRAVSCECVHVETVHLYRYKTDENQDFNCPCKHLPSYQNSIIVALEKGVKYIQG